MSEYIALATLLRAIRKSRSKTVREAIHEMKLQHPLVFHFASFVGDVIEQRPAEHALSVQQFVEACVAFDLGPGALEGVVLGTYDAGQGLRYSMTKGQDRELGPLVS